MSEFASLEPSGRFYLKRPLAEDASAKLRKAAPGTIVDLNAAITNITEAMATVIAFANVLGVDPKSTELVSSFATGISEAGVLCR